MDVASRLDSVTVYAAGAVCRRLALLPEPTGSTLCLVGLPLSLRPASLRASVVAGESGLRVVDVRAGLRAGPRAEADLPALRQSLETAEEELSRLTTERATIDSEIADLQGVRPVWPIPAEGAAPRAAQPHAVIALADFLAQRLESLQAQRQQLARQIEDAHNQVELLRRRLAESGAPAAGRLTLARTAMLRLSAPAPAGTALAVEYLVPGARWAPCYTLRLARGLATGTLAIGATVAQATGEDWAGVALALSTADLDRRSELPELQALKIGRAQPPAPRSGWRETPPGLDELFEGFDAAVSPARAPKLHKRAVLPGRAMMAGAAPPPAPSMLAPAPAAPMMGMRALAPAAASMAPGGSDDESDALPSFDLAVPEPAAAAPAPERPLEPQRALLDYDDLLLVAPDVPGQRGRLRSASEAERIVATSVLVAVSVDVVVAQLHDSTRAAERVANLTLPAQAVAVREAKGSFDDRYDCAQRVDVPTTGNWQLVPVAEHAVALQLGYTTVPAVDPHVYRSLRLVNRGAHALLPGPVHVLAGDDYLLTTQLPGVAPGAAVVLGLGVEESLKVARRTRFKETTAGLLGGHSVLQHEIDVELRSALGRPVELEVRERVPVAEEQDVKVDETQVRPAWVEDEAPHDGVATRGGRAWQVTLAAGETKLLSAQYVVRIPSDRVLVGGNRRV